MQLYNFYWDSLDKMELPRIYYCRFGIVGGPARFIRWETGVWCEFTWILWKGEGRCWKGNPLLNVTLKCTICKQDHSKLMIVAGCALIETCVSKLKIPVRESDFQVLYGDCLLQIKCLWCISEFWKGEKIIQMCFTGQFWYHTDISLKNSVGNRR